MNQLESCMYEKKFDVENEIDLFVNTPDRHGHVRKGPSQLYNLFYPALTGSKTATDGSFLYQMNRQKESLISSYSS